MTYQAIGTANGSGTTATPVLPTHAVGDLMFLVAESSATDMGADPNPGGTEPWTKLVDLGLSATNRCAIWYRKATSTSQTNPTVSPTTPNHTWANVITYRSVHPVLFVHAVASAEATGLTTTGAIPGLTTYADDCDYLGVIAWSADSAGPLASGEANATLTGLTERGDDGTISNNGGGVTLYSATKPAAGTIGETTVTLVSTSYCAVAIAIAPLPNFKIDVQLLKSGVAHAGDGVLQLLDVSQPEASKLAIDGQTGLVWYEQVDGSGQAEMYVPYDDHSYIVIYSDDSLGYTGCTDALSYSGGSFPLATIEVLPGGGGGSNTYSKSRVVNQ